MAMDDDFQKNRPQPIKIVHEKAPQEKKGCC